MRHTIPGSAPMRPGSRLSIVLSLMASLMNVRLLMRVATRGQRASEDGAEFDAGNGGGVGLCHELAEMSRIFFRSVTS